MLRAGWAILWILLVIRAAETHRVLDDHPRCHLGSLTRGFECHLLADLGDRHPVKVFLVDVQRVGLNLRLVLDKPLLSLLAYLLFLLLESLVEVIQVCDVGTVQFCLQFGLHIELVVLGLRAHVSFHLTNIS